VITIGRMKKRITLQNDTGTTVDAYGEKTEAWADVYTCWASIVPLRGRELYQSKQIYPEVDGKIIIRYYDVKPEYRIKYGSRYFKIKEVIQHDEGLRVTELRYTEDV